MIRGRLPIYYVILICIMANTYLAIGEEFAQGFDGITKPVSDIELSFAQPGNVQEIMENEGDEVQPGDILMHMDDEIELIQQKILKGRAENRGVIELPRTDLLQKQKDLEKISEAYDKGAVTQWEVDHAAIAVDSALLKLKIKEFEKSQDVLKLESLVGKIKKLTLVSPTYSRVGAVV